jgi:hypothetical protein
MKKILAALTLISFTTSQTFAWTGGPWSGNTYDGNTGGLFGGSITMRDGNGIFRFTGTETAQLGAFNSSMIYYKGITYLGSCQAQVDFEFRTVSGVTNGSAYNRNNRPASGQSTPLNENDAGYSPEVNPATFTFTSSIGGSSRAGGEFDGPVGIANTSWQGKVTSTRPSLRFTAKGEAAFRGRAPFISRFTVVSTDDVTDIAPDGTDRDISYTITEDYGGDDELKKPRNRTKIRVYGSRLSSVVRGSIGNETAATGTGGGGFSF